jgi:hypothetical protein
MANDISGFGLKLWIVASNTYPAGFPVSQFADDADPLDLPSITIAETGMGVNGDLVKWSKANPLKITVSVIPGSVDDINLGVLFDANRVARGKRGARDKITATVSYGDDAVAILKEGIITDGMPANSVASAGRLKSKTYGFTFEDVSRVA